MINLNFTSPLLFALRVLALIIFKSYSLITFVISRS